MSAIIQRWQTLIAAFAKDRATIIFTATALNARFLKQFPQLSRSRNVQLYHQETCPLTVASEVPFPLSAPIEEDQSTRDKHKKILEDGNTKKIEKVKNSFYTRANLRSTLRTTNQLLQNEIEAAVWRWSWNSNWKSCACDDFAKQGVLWYKRGSCGIWVLKVRSEWHSLYGCLWHICFKMA